MALLTDPFRMPEWDQMLGSVEAAETPTGPRLGDRWVGRARAARPDGKPLKIKAEFQRQSIQLHALEPETHVVWRVTYPDAKLANTRVTRIDLTPAAGGTQLAITYGWERHPDRQPRPPLGFLLRPLTRYAIWMQLTHISAGISRAFR